MQEIEFLEQNKLEINKIGLPEGRLFLLGRHELGDTTSESFSDFISGFRTRVMTTYGNAEVLQKLIEEREEGREETVF